MIPATMTVNRNDAEINTQNRMQYTIEEALSLSKFGLLNYVLIVISGMIMTAVTLEIMSTSYVIAVAGCELQLTTSQKGILGAVVILGVIVSSHLWGFLADTQGRRKVIVPTLFLTFAMTTVSSFSSNFAWMATCRFLVGFFISGSSASLYPYLGEFHTNARRSNAIMGASFIFGMGCMLLPGIAFLTINNSWVLEIPFLNFRYRPWRLFLVACSFPGFVSAIALLKFPESPKFLLSKGRTTEASEAIRWIHRWNTRGKEPTLQIELVDSRLESQKQREQPDSTGICSTLKLIWNQTAPLFMKPYLKRTILVCTLQFGTYVTAHGMFMFFPGNLDKVVSIQHDGINTATICDAVYARQNASLDQIALDVDETESCNETLIVATYGYSLVTEIVFMLGGGVVALTINTVGRLSVLVVVYTCCGIAGILLAFVNVPSAVIWIYIIFVCPGLNGNVTNAVTVDSFPTNFRAMAVSISLMFGRLGTIFGTNMNGLLLDTHCELTFWIAGGIMLLCGILSFFIPGIRNQTGLSESFSTK